MRKYVKPRAKFHELKGDNLLQETSNPKMRSSVGTTGYSEESSYSLNDNSFE